MNFYSFFTEITSENFSDFFNPMMVFVFGKYQESKKGAVSLSLTFDIMLICENKTKSFM